MTVIKVTCPGCGDQDLHAWQLLVHQRGSQFAYEFTCGQCDSDVEHLTDAETAQRLRSVGVRLVQSPPPLSSADIAAATAYLNVTDHLVADILALPTEDSA